MKKELRYYESEDGLKLSFIDVGSSNSNKIPVLCLHALSRNAKDFLSLAERHCKSRRFLCPDFRGRGSSQYDPSYQNYHPDTYVADAFRLLETEGINKVILIGSSLGGLVAMVMAAQQPHKIAGIVLNDIGPEPFKAGYDRVKDYIGRLPLVKNWQEAMVQVRGVYGKVLPDLSGQEWEEFCSRTYNLDNEGVPTLAMDSAVGDAFRELGDYPDGLWDEYKRIKEIPMLVIRGALSDFLPIRVLKKMALLKPDLSQIEVPRRGHIPLMTEPSAMAAIDLFLDKI